MPTSRNNPAVRLKMGMLHAKVFFLSVTLALLFRIMRLLIGHSPTQEELNLIFEKQRVPDELLKPIK